MYLQNRHFSLKSQSNIQLEVQTDHEQFSRIDFLHYLFMKQHWTANVYYYSEHNHRGLEFNWNCNVMAK